MMQKNNFKGYFLSFAPQAKKELKKLEKNIAEKIDEKLKEMVKGAVNLDIIKMQGKEDTYRLRCGDYRIIFEVQDHIVTVLVVSIGHRKEVYRDH